MLPKRQPRRSVAGLTLLFCLVGSLACQQSQTHPQLTETDSPIGIATAREPGMLPLAAFDLTLDATTLAAELIPRRFSTAIGDAWSEVGATSAFTERFGNHFRSSAVRLVGPGQLAVDFETTHPFTLAQRPDLAIFNLKVWVLFHTGEQAIGPIVTRPELLMNATGYGTMWSTTHPALAGIGIPVQPYVVLQPDPSSAPFDWQDPRGWNVFAPGQSSLDTLIFNLAATPQTAVTLVLTADYGQSAIFSTRPNPAYALPEFAGNAPWQIVATELGNTLIGDAPGGEATYQIDIFDWKHGEGLGSNVTAAEFYAPALIGPAPLALDLTGTGRFPTPLTAQATIGNDLAVAEGLYWGLVGAEDAATGTAIAEDLVTQIPVASYRTWQVVPIQVGGGSEGPLARIVQCTAPGDMLPPGLEERFDGTTSVAASAPIVDWEWDFDYNGALFDIDATGAVVWQAFDTPGMITIALRVRDDDGLEDIAQTTLTIGGSASWSTAQALTANISSESWGDFTEPAHAIDVDAEGRVYLVYSNHSIDLTVFTDVYFQELDPCGTTWTAAENIWRSEVSTIAPLNVSLVATASFGGGTDVHVATASADNSFLYLVRQGGVWSAPADLTSGAVPGTWLYGSLAPGRGGRVGFIGVALPAQPNGVVGDGTLALPAEVYFTQLSGATFGAEVEIGEAHVVTALIGDGLYRGLSPSAAVSGTAAGGWVATWESLATPYNGLTEVPATAQTDLRWAERPNIGIWSDAALCYAGAPQLDAPVLALTPNSGLVWLAVSAGLAGDVSLATFDGSDWSPSLTPLSGLPNPAGSAGAQVFLSFDSEGRGALVVGQESVQQALLARFFTESNTLADLAAAPNHVLENPADYTTTWPVVTPTGDGRAVAVWHSARHATPSFDQTEVEWSRWE